MSPKTIHPINQWIKPNSMMNVPASTNSFNSLQLDPYSDYASQQQMNVYGIPTEDPLYNDKSYGGYWPMANRAGYGYEPSYSRTNGWRGFGYPKNGYGKSQFGLKY